WHGAILNYKMLPLSGYIPRPAAPLNIDTVGGRRKVPRPGFARRVVTVMPIQVRAAIGGGAHAETLPKRISGAAGPGSILIAAEDAAAIRRRRVDKLRPQVELPGRDVHL